MITDYEKGLLGKLPPGVSSVGRRRALAGLVAKRLWPLSPHLIILCRTALMTNTDGMGDGLADEILTMVGEEDFG